ncbi:MAG: pyridoxamine 5'-phosphate oxidase family protein [Acidobacteria bacterium]|nr:pyridoxamine 5'-phosphate oxidase family protein [Acidobacteriota bacterium]
MPGHIINTLEELRKVYPPAIERARIKTLTALDQHCQAFIALAPLVCLGTQNAEAGDVSPRGDAPGFVHVLDPVTLAMPDWPGNNRLDSFENIVVNPNVGLLFLIPGVDESLRINGVAAISTDPDLLNRWTVNGRNPRSVVIIRVREAFLHCGKALIRSRLWHAEARVERSALPSYGRMLKDQICIGDTAEQIEASVAEAYANRLY